MAASIRDVKDNWAINRGRILLSSPHSQDIQSLIGRLKQSPGRPVSLSADWYDELKSIFGTLGVPIPYIRRLSLQYLEDQLQSDDPIIEKKLRLGQHKYLSNRFIDLIKMSPVEIAIDWNLGIGTVTPHWLELETYWTYIDDTLPQTSSLLRECWRDTLHSVAMYIEMMCNPQTEHLCPQIYPLVDWLLNGHFVYDTMDRLYVLEP